MSLQVDKTDPVVVVSLDHGPVNALDLALCEQIAGVFGELSADSRTRAVVITGNTKVFSAGVDLRALSEGGAAYVRRFLPALSAAFRAVFASPKPTVAAVNGHAIAGGCVIALACDRTVMVDGNARVGLTELMVGVPFPAMALEIARYRLGRSFPTVILDAESYLPPMARDLGLVDEVVAPEALRGRAVEIAGRLAAVPGETYRMVKSAMIAPALERTDSAEVSTEAAVVEAWASEENLARVAEFLAARKS